MEDVYARLKCGELLPDENLADKMDVIEKRESTLNAFISIFDKISIPDDGILNGVVVGVKDNFAVRGKRMTCGSKMLENYVPDYNATVVERLMSEGALIVGKNNMDEFACGSSGETSYFGPTRNPINPDYVPGGSSSGSAAAVASGMVDVSVASDTGGSIRNPACFCGVVGIKPSYGLVSRYGLVDLAMSMDCPGVLARDAFGVALVMDVINGRDEKDQTTVSKLKFLEKLNSFNPDGVRIGVCEDFLNVDPKIRKITERTVGFFERKGAEVVNFEFSYFKYALSSYYICVYAEFASSMQKFDGLKYGYATGEFGLFERVSRTRAEALGREVKRRILLGTFVSMKEYADKWYTKALIARRRIQVELEAVLKDVDFIVLPTMPILPFRLGERVDDPVKMYMCDVLTVLPNLAGLPAISFPAGDVGGFKVGVQLVGRMFDDPFLVSAVRFFEKEGGV